MKQMLSLCAAALCLTLALTPTALAADFEPAVPNVKVCYPTAITQSEDGTELRKLYDLGPEDDPVGIPRSDFEQDGLGENAYLSGFTGSGNPCGGNSHAACFKIKRRLQWAQLHKGNILYNAPRCAEVKFPCGSEVALQ